MKSAHKRKAATIDSRDDTIGYRGCNRKCHSGMIGLPSRQIPFALAEAPASIISVLLMVGRINELSGYAQVALAVASGQDITTLGYYYQRRGPCKMCCRGTLYT
jgi:hypothetical protein